MADLNNLDKKLDLILQKQQEIENKIDKMEKVINKIESDIYMEEDFDFEIVCPYCNHEFITDISDGKTEVTCPDCENVIELDWTVDIDGCGHAGCEGCHGCEPEDEDDDM